MYAEASEAPVRQGCRSAHRPGRKPSSLLNRLLKFPMAVRLPSLMHSRRSVFPKSTVSHLLVQYGYARYVFPSTPCSRCQCQRKVCAGLCSSQGSLAFPPPLPSQGEGESWKTEYPWPWALCRSVALRYTGVVPMTRANFLGGPGDAPEATVVARACSRRALGAGGRDGGG